MGRIRILDPTAPPPATDADPGPDAGSLTGRRVGLRFDRTWRSFEVVLAEWEPRLRDAGADVLRWCAGNRVGEDGEHTFAALESFATDVDLAVVGLGN